MPPPVPTPSEDMTLVSALEARIIGYLDKRLGALENEVHDQGTKIDRLLEERVPRGEFDTLRGRVEKVERDTAVDARRLDVVESAQKTDDTSRRARPFQTWQVVVGAVGIIAVLASLVFDAFMVMVDFINIGLTLLALFWHH